MSNDKSYHGLAISSGGYIELNLIQYLRSSS
jgi:hypothetical protein